MFLFYRLLFIFLVDIYLVEHHSFVQCFYCDEVGWLSGFYREDGTAYGGHLNEAVIGGAGEIFLTVINGKVFREIDDETGLNVFLFPQNGIF